MSVNNDRILEPVVMSALAGYLDQEQVEEVAGLVDPNNVNREDRFKDLCQTHYRLAIRPPNITWEEHYNNCKTDFYLRIKMAYRRGQEWFGRNCKTIEKGLKIAGSVALVGSALYAVPGAAAYLLGGAAVGAAIDGYFGYRRMVSVGETRFSNIVKGIARGALSGASAGAIGAIATVSPKIAATIAGGIGLIDGGGEEHPALEKYGPAALATALTATHPVAATGISLLTHSDLALSKDYLWTDQRGQDGTRWGRFCAKASGAFNWFKTAITG